MYCPTCATQNGDDSKYCRACGTNLSLVPQAITGQLKLPRRSRHDPRYLERAGTAAGITQSFMGLGFLMVALALGISHSGRGWWYWLLFPAFMFLGRGVAMIVSAMQANRKAALQMQQPQERITGEYARPESREFPLPPPSITETTTRQLDRDKY